VEVRNIARWDGIRWSPVGTGIGPGGANIEVRDMIVHDDGSGAALYAVGTFTLADDKVVSNVARWNGQEWSDVGGGFDDSAAGAVVFDEDGAGPNPPRLFVTGDFRHAGGKPIECIARWDGQSWSAVGEEFIPNAGPATVFDSDGNGPGPEALYVAGTAAGVWKWDGMSWETMPWVITYSFDVLESFAAGPDGPGLYAGGRFKSVDGISVNGIARWDGQNWHAMGTGVDGLDQNHAVESILVCDLDGGGPDAPGLVAGGGFDFIDGVRTDGLARWDGAAWRPVSEDTTGFTHVETLAMFDADGPGPAPADLHFAGRFYNLGKGAIFENIARFGPPPRWLGYADCNADGVLDLFDFLCFVNDFNDGC
jgi:hypothetical protein